MTKRTSTDSLTHTLPYAAAIRKVRNRTTPRRVKAGTALVDLGRDIPFWVAPRTAAAYDAMVEQMARAVVRTGCRDKPSIGLDVEIESQKVRRQLRAIGITRPKD